MRETLDISVRVLKRLAVPYHTLRSWSMVARRERLTDDQITRALARAAELAGGALTEVRDNRLVPTALGHEFYKTADPLLNLGQAETTEVLTVATSPAVDPALVARTAIAFSKEWGRLVGFRLVVCPAGIREMVERSHAAFGIVEGGELHEADERLGPTAPLVALIPDRHRLAGADCPLDRDHFAPTDRVYFGPRLVHALGDLLVRVPPINQAVVECPQTLRALVESGAGIGFEHGHPGRFGSLNRVPVLGTEPLVLGLVLPRKRDQLTEPARFFLDVLRRAETTEQPPVPSPDEFPAPGSAISEQLSV